MTEAITNTGLRVKIGGFYRWEYRSVRVTWLFSTSEGPWAAIWVPDRGKDSRRNVSVDELRVR